MAGGRAGSLEIVLCGLRQLRANWQLVPVVAVQSLVTSALLVGGLILPLVALGAGSLAWLWRLRDTHAVDPAGWLEGLAETGRAALVPLAAALLAATILWLLAFLLFCYFQGGVLGVLASGDRRAGRGAGWQAYRAFALAELHRHGRRLLWRYFWFNHLLGAVLTLWLLALAVWLALAAAGVERFGPRTTVAAGCFGLLPLAVALVAILLWGALASADLARDGSSLGRASWLALRVLRRDLGAVLAVALIGGVGWLAAGALLAPVGWSFDLAAGDSWSLWAAGQVVLAAAQWLANAAVTVGVGGSLVALVRAEAA